MRELLQGIKPVERMLLEFFKSFFVMSHMNISGSINSVINTGTNSGIIGRVVSIDSAKKIKVLRVLKR